MVREPSEGLLDIAENYVCLRVLDMSRVDLNVFEFDYDLTFAALLMHPDGHVYHRFGSRDSEEPTVWNTMDGLERLMRTTLDEYRVDSQQRDTALPRDAEPRRVIDLPPLARKRERNAKLRNSCVHCHTVHETLHHTKVERKLLQPDDHWIYPDPIRLGITLDRDDQSRITNVAERSIGSQALRAGDRLIQVGVQARVATIGDLMFALHKAPAKGGSLPTKILRGDTVMELDLELPSGWKRGTVEEYTWRPYKWGLSPAPGFGGPMLNAHQRKQLEIPDGQTAFRVQYIVNWGDKAHRGRRVARAGLRTGDVVLAYDGKSDFRDPEHFHTWVRLTKQAGDEVDVVVLRKGQRKTIRYALPR